MDMRDYYAYRKGYSFFFFFFFFWKGGGGGCLSFTNKRVHALPSILNMYFALMCESYFKVICYRI